MSELMAVIEVCGERLICIDYDRPVWHAKGNFEIRATPNLDHFVVDGILATLSNAALMKFGITKRFISEDFESNQPSKDLIHAREILYQAKDLKIDYFHDQAGDIQIHQDLARFRMPLGKVLQVTSEELSKLTI
jgi:hypothetical protein